MSKVYNLEIENVGDDTYIVMSKGHHDADEFMREVRKCGYKWPLGHPKHVYIKATPDNVNGGIIYNVVNRLTRGCFPATYSWESYGEDSYDYKAYLGFLKL